MYTIGQVSEMFDLPISTLRYYDKEGFFPNLVRKGNIRYFSNNEIEALRLIECLKKSGLGIKEINQFFTWVSEGSSSFEKRKELFEARKLAVEAEIKNLQKTLSLLEFKCWRMVQKNTFVKCFQTSFLVIFKNYMMQVTNNEKWSRGYSAPKLFKTSWLVLILID